MSGRTGFGPVAAGISVAVLCGAVWVTMSVVRPGAVYHFHPGLLAAAGVWVCRRKGERRLAALAALAAAAAARLVAAGGRLIDAWGGSLDAAPLIAAIVIAGFAAGTFVPVGPRSRWEGAVARAAERMSRLG